jgi:hypothetical protein
MTSSRVVARLVSRVGALLETAEGQVILDGLNATESRDGRARILIVRRNDNTYS